MRAILLLSLLCAVATRPLRGAEFEVQTLAQGLVHPWSLAMLPDGRVLVTERPGRLRIWHEGTLGPPVPGLPTVYATGQAGLLEVLPAPDFAASGMLYLSFVHGDAAANALRVARARLGEHGLERLQTLFTARPWKQGDVHYGGRMAWHGDGTLLVTLGDGFVLREQAQRLDSHLGKIVRLRADGSVPPDNPFVGHADALPEIFSLGHRNVQGLVVDARTGVVLAHEHGPRGGDELNRIVAGANYGWPIATHGLDYTGARVSPYTDYPGMTAPLRHWTPSIAPAGMTLYHGALFPQWRGSLFIANLAERSLRRLPPDGGADEVLLTDLDERLREVREAPDGSLWLLTDSPDARLLRLVPRATAPR